MSLDTLQYFFQRMPRLNYVSPPICEMEFSSSAFPNIILNPHARRLGPTGFEFFVQDGRIFLRWNNYPGAICFSIYKAVDEDNPNGDFHLVAECVQEPVDITDFGPGVYRVSAITPDGETVFSDPITVPPGPEACIETPGPLAPFGLTPFEIESEVFWPEVVVQTPLATGVAGFLTQPLIEDYPPGHYDVKYVRGSFIGDPCGFGNTTFAAHLAALGDDNFAGPFAGNGLCGSTYIVNPPTDDPNNSGFTDCAPNGGVAETVFQTHFNTPGVDRRFKHSNRHENLGGTINFLFDPDISGDPPVIFNNFTLRPVQVDGLIQQPRGVRITNYGIVAAGFPTEVSTNWNGELPERTTYEQDECVWTADPNGAFGGAFVRYSQAVPNSPTGTGWEMTVFVGVTLVWKGFKKYDETGVGDYFRAVDSPSLTPLCLHIEEIPT